MGGMRRKGNSTNPIPKTNRFGRVQLRLAGTTRFELAFALASILAMLVAVPALAAYLGPDRDYTATVT